MERKQNENRDIDDHVNRHTDRNEDSGRHYNTFSLSEKNNYHNVPVNTTNMASGPPVTNPMPVNQGYQMGAYQVQYQNQHSNMNFTSPIQGYSQGLSGYQSQLPPLNRVNVDFKFPIMHNSHSLPTNDLTLQNSEIPSSFGFNPFVNAQYRIPAYNTASLNNGQIYIAARPLKVVPFGQQNGGMGSYMVGDNKLILKATPLQQVIQIPLSMVTQPQYAQGGEFHFLRDQFR